MNCAREKSGASAGSEPATNARDALLGGHRFRPAKLRLGSDRIVLRMSSSIAFAGTFVELAVSFEYQMIEYF
jgi:hypothetical protein